MTEINGHDRHIPPIDPGNIIIEHRGDPYLRRIDAMLRAWIQEEWFAVTAVEADAAKNGWTSERKARLADAVLTPKNLAWRLDNISVAKLQRELRKLRAPRASQLIRTARIVYAHHLILNTRLLVREIARRCGYDDEEHFARLFTAAYGASPQDYKRNHIRNITSSN